MKVHEYQGKALLKKYQIPIQDGVVVDDPENIEDAIREVQTQFDTEAVVVKAQVHAGGRGKGGGVKFSSTFAAAKDNARNILGMNLVTHQTGEAGQKVRKIMIADAVDIDHEYYVAITLDRSVAKDVFMVSTEGGVDIEQVAEQTPEKITKVWIDPLLGMQSYQARKLAFALGFKKDTFKAAVKIFLSMYQCYTETDASLVEINPLVLIKQGDVIALDAKFNFDDNSLFRQKDIADLRDLYEEDPTEVEAGKYNLNYIKLTGDVGCMVNGAGLAMATMDIIKLAGGEPANFLDVGGTASAETVKNGFKIILSDDHVKAVLINIFGGIVRCDRVANGVVDAIKELDLSVPVVVRLEGTNASEAKDILEQSGMDIIPADSMKDAAEKVVATASNGK